ncbi:MAG: maleylpyruvate isomerase N-terminal domain-containing protein [Sphingobacteriia bacterium]|nr:maleylpyruvate isomerase N-terminal domain-containing protein [Sphingobacteriia bacterium]
MLSLHSNIPINTLPLFPLLDLRLLEMLRELTPEEWNRPTIAKQWTVKDIAAHLLDGNLRGLSVSRDGYFGISSEAIHSYRELVVFLNRLNHQWTDAAKRLSPPLLISLLELTDKEYHEHLLSLNPFDEAVFGVAWAGQERSENWFHIAREYTEKFIHQQQIRDALGKEPLFSEILFRPFISTLMYALPVAYKNTEAPEGTIIALQIGSATGEEYRIIRNYNGWSLTEVSEAIATSTIQMNPDTAWKVFSKGISPEMALEQVTITGNAALGKITLEMVAVMA